MGSRRFWIKVAKWVFWTVFVVLLLFVALIARAIYVNDNRQEAREREGYYRTGYDRADRTPRWSPKGDYIIANLENSIYRVEFPGGEVKPVLKDDKVGYYSPSLSPDGRIAYNEYDPNKGENKIRILDAAGEKSRTLGTLNITIAPLLWSPDGSRLVYRRFRDDVPGAFAVVHSGSSPEVFWPDRGIFWLNSAWSYDSQYLALPGRDGDSPGLNLVVSKQGGEETVTIDRTDDDEYPYLAMSGVGWTANGELYYAKAEPKDGAGQISIYRAHPDSWEPQLVADMTAQTWEMRTQPHEGDTGEVLVEELRIEAIHWVKPSPDGTKMLLSAEAVVGDKESARALSRTFLWTVGDRLLVPIWSSSRYLSWSPDGQWIVGCSKGPGRLYIMDSSGENSRLLYTEEEVSPHLPRR